MILRELDLLKHPNLSLRHLAQDGFLSKFHGLLIFIHCLGVGARLGSHFSYLVFLIDEIILLTFTPMLTLFCLLDNQLEVLPGTCAEHLFSIEIDIAIAPDQHLYERFEWDLTSPDNSPEEFAACLVSDYLFSLGATNSFTQTDVLKLEKLVSIEIRRKIDL